MAKLLKWLIFVTVFFTSIILPAIFLETSFSKYGEIAIVWAGENNFYTPKTVWNTGNLGWDLNLWKHYNFPNISNFKRKEYFF